MEMDRGSCKKFKWSINVEKRIRTTKLILARKLFPLVYSLINQELITHTNICNLKCNINSINPIVSVKIYTCFVFDRNPNLPSSDTTYGQFSSFIFHIFLFRKEVSPLLLINQLAPSKN